MYISEECIAWIYVIIFVFFPMAYGLYNAWKGNV
jgi:hypothetical protein